MNLHSFYIVTRPFGRNLLLTLKKLLSALSANGFEWGLEDWVLAKYPSLTKEDSLPLQSCDAILSVGGDGTFLVSAQMALKNQIPILGVNVGRVGFLTEIEQKEINTAFAEIREDHVCLKERMLLLAEYDHRKEYALNDVVVSRGEYTKAIDLDVSVGDEFLGRFIADGFIVASPTGSTGYSLSAGGPIVSPRMDCMVLTPVCAHSLQNRSVVISPGERVSIGMHEKRDCHMLISCDGREPVFLENGDVLRIQAAEKKLFVIQIHEDSFLARVQARLNL